MTLTDFSSVSDSSVTEWTGRDISPQKIRKTILKNLILFEKVYCVVRELGCEGEMLPTIAALETRAPNLFRDDMHARDDPEYNPVFETGLTAFTYYEEYARGRQFYLEELRLERLAA